MQTIQLIPFIFLLNEVATVINTISDQLANGIHFVSRNWKNQQEQPYWKLAVRLAKLRQTQQTSCINSLMPNQIQRMMEYQQTSSQQTWNSQIYT